MDNNTDFSSVVKVVVTGQTGLSDKPFIQTVVIRR